MLTAHHELHKWTSFKASLPILIHSSRSSIIGFIWIGGLAFLVIAVTPGLKVVVAKDQVTPITDTFYQHYKTVAGILLMVLLFTGGINLHDVNQVVTAETGSGIQHHATYQIVFFIKLFLVLCLLTHLRYTVFFKSDEAIPF